MISFKKIISAMILASLLTLPAFAQAQSPLDIGYSEEITVRPEGPSNFVEFVRLFLDLILSAIPVVIGLAFLAFVWGIVKFIRATTGDEKGLQEAKNIIKWGIIAMFITVSVFGILNLVYNELQFGLPFGFPKLPT